MKKNSILDLSLFIRTFLFCMISLACYQAKAQCGLAIAANNITTTWDLSWTIQSVSITVSKTNPAACTFGLGFTKGVSASYTRYALNGAAQLHYQVYNDAGATNVLKDVPDPLTVNDVIMVTLPAGSGPQIVQYYFDIPYALATAPLLTAAGVYTDSFIINAYEGNDPTLYVAPAAATATVNLTLTVDKQINLSLIDLGGMFDETKTTKSIDFGSFRTGNLSRFNLSVRTNAGFSITLSSLNGGNFKHVSNAATVPYTIHVNNVLADLTGVVPVVTGTGQTSLSGLVYPSRITIGNVNPNSVAGSYQDTVTITAITTD